MTYVGVYKIVNVCETAYPTTPLNPLSLILFRLKRLPDSWSKVCPYSLFEFVELFTEPVEDVLAVDMEK